MYNASNIYFFSGDTPRGKNLTPLFPHNVPFPFWLKLLCKHLKEVMPTYGENVGEVEKTFKVGLFGEQMIKLPKSKLL